MWSLRRCTVKKCCFRLFQYIELFKGTVTANRVINCCGFHGRDVGLLAGLDLPLVPVQHQYLVTKSVPEVQALDKEIPVLRHLEGSFYLRQERDGLLIGPYESQSAMVQMEAWTRQGELEGGRNSLLLDAKPI